MQFSVTNNPTWNRGGYIAITNSDPKTEQTAETGAALFLTSRASGVRLITLTELNEARNLSTDPDNGEIITVDQDPTGLYRLDSVGLVPEIGDTNYNTGAYWLASPWPGINDRLDAVRYNGEIKYVDGSAIGVRPVVKISRF